MPRRRGWDYAQLKSDFLSDPEFRHLRDSAADRREFVAAVGEWTIALADAWREDNPLVAHADAKLLTLLQTAHLVDDGGRLVGFDKWTAPLRAVREADAARKRTPPDSDGIRRKPPESVGLSREVKLEGRESETGATGPLDHTSREGSAPPGGRTYIRGMKRGGPRATTQEDPART